MSRYMEEKGFFKYILTSATGQVRFNPYCNSTKYIELLCIQPIQPGLLDLEIDMIENNYGFIFPPDLKLFLQQGMKIPFCFEE